MILLINSDSTLLTSTTLLSTNFNDSTINQSQPQQQQQQSQQRSTSEIQSQLFNELFLIQEQISLLTLNILPLHYDLTQTSIYLPRIGPLAQNIRYMIQTYDSIVTFDIPRSIEHLRLLIFYDQQIHSLLMKQFFTYYSLRYSCSMSLALTLTSIQDNNSNSIRINDDRLRDLGFQTFLWYSSSAYLQYLETLQHQQQQQLSLDQSRFYQLQPQQPFNRSTTLLPTIFLRQRNFFERYIIPLRINAILFVLSDILRPIWTQKLIELKSLSKQDKTIYYIFHQIHDYNEIKNFLKQLQHFLKKLAPHMCCIWSNKDDLPEYNEQLAQRIFAQQNIQIQPQQQQISTINTNNNLYLRSALTGRLHEQQQPQQQTIHHAHSYPNISTYSQSPYGN